MRLPTFAASLFTFAAAAAAQCPYYSDGTISAGLSRFNGGEDARLVYVDCVSSIGLIDAKFGTTSMSTNLDGLPLTIAVYDDPTDDMDPSDAVLVAQTTVVGGVTGGNTGEWQRYDLTALFGAPVAANGGMWVALGVEYPAGTNPGPGSIEFFNNDAPGTQWLMTDTGGFGIDYANPFLNDLVDIQTGPGFPPGSWVIRVESGAEYRSFGAGCSGSNGTPTLSGSGVLPQPGLAILFDASNLPDPTVLNLILIGFDELSPAIDVGAIFGPAPVGCGLLVNPASIELLPSSGGLGSWALPLPATPDLVGASIVGQAVCADPGANPANWTTSNGVRAVVGN